MSTITESNNWDATVNQIDNGEIIDHALLNAAPQSLANRTLWLKNKFAGHRHDGINAPHTYTWDNGNAGSVNLAGFVPPLEGTFPGLPINFIAKETNNGPSTITIEGMVTGAQITRPDGALLEYGNIRANGIYTVIVSGTVPQRIVLLNPSEPVGKLRIGLSVNTPSGYLGINGALLSRVTYPDLWGWAQMHAPVVTEAAWASGNHGAFSTGDGSTTFRTPRFDGEFPRFLNQLSSGADANRALGSWQADQIKAHDHNVGFTKNSADDGSYPEQLGKVGTYGNADPSFTVGGNETRPRNIAIVPYIKY